MALKVQAGDTYKYASKAYKSRLNAMANNAAPTDSEKFSGLATAVYGGYGNSGDVTSFMTNLDAYFKAATTRSIYDDNTFNNRRFNSQLILDRTTLSQIQPYIKGHVVFVVGYMPRFMEILYPKETNYMRTIFQSAIVEISGFKAKSLTATEVSTPSKANSYSVITGAEGGNTTELNITFMTDFQGTPIIKYITTWMHLIYSPGSTAALYPHYTTLSYDEGSHSMTAVYIVTDPSYQLVEDAALIYAMVPLSNGEENLLNQSWGQHSIINNLSIPFKVYTLQGMPQCTDIAQALLVDYVSEVELNDYWVRSTESYTSPNKFDMGIGDNLLGENGKAAFKAAEEIRRQR